MKNRIRNGMPIRMRMMPITIRATPGHLTCSVHAEECRRLTLKNISRDVLHPTVSRAVLSRNGPLSRTHGLGDARNLAPFKERVHPGAGTATFDPFDTDLDLQATALFTRVAILASSAGVRSFSAKSVGHMWPSSRFASSLKPSVVYRVLNFSAGRKKQTIWSALA